jgi:hypothetical protein
MKANICIKKLKPKRDIRQMLVGQHSYVISLITYAIVYNFGGKAFVLFCFQQSYWDCSSYSIYNTKKQDSIEWKHLIHVRRSVTLPDNMRFNRIYSALAVQNVNRDNASAKSGYLWEGTSQLQDALGAVGPWKRRHPPSWALYIYVGFILYARFQISHRHTVEWNL